MGEPVDLTLSEELSKCVDKLVTSGKKELDQSIMKKLKSICKKSDSYVDYVFHVIMTYLEKDHAQIRYSCLMIINELFQRSHAFRNLLLTDFQTFLELTAETDPEEPLPPPKNVAKDLKIRTLELVQEWHQKFGEGYKKLVLGYNYLRTCKKIDFNNIDARNVAQRRQEEEQRQQQARMSAEKVAKVTAEMEEFSEEVKSTVMQLNNCLNILFPSPDDLFQETDFDNPRPGCSKELTGTLPPKEHFEVEKEEVEEADEELVREHGLGNLKYSLAINVESNVLIKKDENTSIVIDNLNELYEQVKNRYVPMVSRWIQILTKETGSSPADLKKAIDLKNELKAVAEKCAELKIHVPPVSAKKDDDDSDDSDFEEVEDKEGYEAIIPPHRRKEYGLEPAALSAPINNQKATSKDWNIKPDFEEIKDPTTRIANIFAMSKKIGNASMESAVAAGSSGNKSESANASDKTKLLAKAPRRPYDTDLYFWEEEKLEPPTIVQFDSLHKFWKPIESDHLSEVHKEASIAALRTRTIEFTGEFVPVKWSCRAPLPSGKLCPRKDRYKCPFHGPIIPRDNMGNPTDQSNSTSNSEESKQEVPDWQDPEYLRDLKAATGIDLELPSTRKKGKDSRKDKSRKRRHPGLVDVKKIEDNSRKRLEKKVLNKSSVRRVAETLDTIDQKRFNDKFGNQWQYSFKT